VTISRPNVNSYRRGSVTRPTCDQVILFTVMDLKLSPVHTRSLQRQQSVNTVRESPSVPNNSSALNTIIAVIIFFAAHFALLVGVTTPEKSISMKCIMYRPRGKCSNR
jgi:hypothetical protein